MIGAIFVEALPEKCNTVLTSINKIENVIRVNLIIHEPFNIISLTEVPDFMSLSKVLTEINDIDGVKNTTHGIYYGSEWRPDALSVLKDKKARTSLNRYFDVVEDKKAAKFLIAQKFATNFKKKNTLTELWKIHNQLTEEFLNFVKEIDTHKNSIKYLKKMKKPDKSYLDLKIEISKRILEKCHLCARKCGVNRLSEGLGYCKCRDKMVFSSVYQNWGEEADLVPAGTIFTMGCNMRCLHCGNWEISQWIKKGEVYSPKRSADVVKSLRRSGSRNAFLSGEPTPWLPHWLEAFKHVNMNVPVVWNSNAYYSHETAKLLSSFIDLYVLDFKYGSNTCAEKISEAPNYLEVCTRNYLHSKKYGELIIRVLVLPEHYECCTRKILNWIALNLGIETRTHLVLMYQPMWRSNEISELRRRLTTDEIERAVELAKEIGFSNLIL